MAESNTLVQKLMVNIGEFLGSKKTKGFLLGLFGLALDVVGYRPNLEQSAATLDGMKAIMVAFPAGGLILGGIAMLFYPLRGGAHEAIVGELALRRPLVTEAVG